MGIRTRRRVRLNDGRAHRVRTALGTTAVVVGMAVACTGLAACQPATTIQQSAGDPGYTLRHDWGPSVVIESGVANSCYNADSNVSGRKNVCRVVDGYEQVGDNRNWTVTANSSAILKDVSRSSGNYGRMIVLDGGQVFEGCAYLPSTGANKYQCDYRVRKQIILKTSGGAYSYVLRKLWNWTKYTGSVLGCAGGIAGVWRGDKISAALLAGCVDGPM